jgi:Cystathionine beta-lyase family protein involved in aluminum resistance
MNILTLSQTAETALTKQFELANEICMKTSAKVLAAFTENRVSETHFGGTTGYGYNDIGRDVCDRVFARAMGAQAAVVSYAFASGTHTINTALFGISAPGTKIVCITGKPYDTLENVITDLSRWGVSFEVSDDVSGADVVYIQRSRGYDSTRPSLTICEIEKLIKQTKKANPTAIIAVDNCYGEFVEELEPCDVDADLCFGSLIKNPGGGIAKCGGYIAGRTDLVERCNERLTVRGIGREIGATLGSTREILAGLYFAPSVVCGAVKTNLFALKLFSLLGFKVSPTSDEPRGDIVGTIYLETAENVGKFCKGIQSASPIDSFAAPLPAPMPGYDCDVIMAAGAFVSGSSIELSADGPIRPPYCVYLQGGVTYEYGKLGVLNAAKEFI